MATKEWIVIIFLGQIGSLEPENVPFIDLNSLYVNVTKHRRLVSPRMQRILI